jgi:hypothetical protein
VDIVASHRAGGIGCSGIETAESIHGCWCVSLICGGREAKCLEGAGLKKVMGYSVAWLLGSVVGALYGYWLGAPLVESLIRSGVIGIIVVLGLVLVHRYMYGGRDQS